MKQISHSFGQWTIRTVQTTSSDADATLPTESADDPANGLFGFVALKPQVAGMLSIVGLDGLAI